jgi:hypothetical protein
MGWTLAWVCGWLGPASLARGQAAIRQAGPGTLGWQQRRASWPDGRVAPGMPGAPRKVRAPQGRVVGNADPG